MVAFFPAYAIAMRAVAATLSDRSAAGVVATPVAGLAVAAVFGTGYSRS